MPDESWERLPEGLSGMTPGGELAEALATIERDRLDGPDRVVLMVARARMLAHVQAQLLADMESLHRYESENPDNLEVFWTSDIEDLTASEIQAALHLTPNAAATQLDLAHRICRLPRLWEALDAGLIDLARARVIVEETRHLSPVECEEVVDGILPAAQTLTTGQLRVRLSRLCMTTDPESAVRRYEQALCDRRVVSDRTPAGTGCIYATDLPAPATQSIMSRINRLARAAKQKDDPRSMDQIRADVYLDLLLGKDQTGRRQGSVDIHVELTTLLGLDDKPGELAGYGPLVADVTRRVVEEQEKAPHTVTVTDHDEIIWTGITRRRPTATQTRQVRAENPTCVFPGCRMPAGDCDLDHRQTWSQGGPTHPHNLEPLCRRDHRRRHNGWTITRLGPGRYQWTSPLGRVYVTRSHDPP
ncbi:MAG: HNH endonuclease [Actinobacteria bacterium]|nr:HNH endonuclease [Actinomycetota bacterium]